MQTIRSLCVYCGSGPGSDPAFTEAAHRLGQILAERGVDLVYGGGSVGLMGTLARAVAAHGGHVTGIIPEFLMDRERAMMGTHQIIVTRNMHERKQQMFERADAFVALPGGLGTLEEVVEQMTWAQLGRHRKPILLANVAGFWNPLCALLDHMRELQFIRPGLSVDVLVADRMEEVLPMLEAAATPAPAFAEAAAAPTIERM